MRVFNEIRFLHRIKRSIKHYIIVGNKYSVRDLLCDVINCVAGRSGLVVACGARGPRIVPSCGQVSVFFTKITAIRSFGHELHTYCSA